MFTGIIEARAQVRSLQPQSQELFTLVLSGPSWLGDAPLGSSVAVDGVCLTLVHAERADDGSGTAGFEVMLQTLGATTLGSLTPAASVNLERALDVRALPAHAARLDGHIVQGHVDEPGEVLRRSDRPGDTRLRIALSPGLAPLVADRGSVAVDGVSLTVAAVSVPGEPRPWFEVALIPATLAATGLGLLRVGDAVNLEADVLARYAARRAQFSAAGANA